MKLGVYGGGFKPFTTGHFAKLADAIRDNDKTILFYGMQQLPKDPVKAKRQKLRGIGKSGRLYDEQIARSVFEIYKSALERIPGVEVVTVFSQAVDNLGNPLPIRSPVSAIFQTLEEFVENPEMYEKVTIYGDRSSVIPYMRSPSFRDLVQQGRIQFGGAVPETYDDYVDKFDELMDRGEKEARDALRSFYQEKGEDLSDEEIEARQTVRGTRVRDLASSESTSQEAKKYLPPFLSDSEKDKIIQILSGNIEEASRRDEEILKSLIMGIIRG